MDTLFCTLDSARIAEIIRAAEKFVCYAGPGIQLEPAKAMAGVAKRLGAETITLCVDFDERVMRMGYGNMEAMKCLHEAGIVVRDSPGLRTALVIVDNQGFIFTPTALYLEAEPQGEKASNAMRLSSQQIAEALARLSPAAKAIAVAQAKTDEERARITELPVEVRTVTVTEEQFNQVDNHLKEVPPVKFDLARQVRVFEPYLQYVELSLSGAAIQRHRLTIPPNIQRLGGSKSLEGRLRTTFDLLKEDSKLSSKNLEEEINSIRQNFTPSLGKDHGRVVLKAAKPHLETRLASFRKNLEAHQKMVEGKLQKQLNESREQIVKYYMPIVIKTKPDSLLGQLLSEKPTKDDARKWLDAELDRVFPSAETLIQNMQLDVRYKDVTFETLNKTDFLKSIKAAFPNHDWDKTYKEFKAAGEVKTKDESGLLNGL